MQTYCYTPPAPLSIYVDIIWISQAERFNLFKPWGLQAVTGLDAIAYWIGQKR